MKHLFTLSIAIIAITLCACNNTTEQKVEETVAHSYTKIENANWLIGKWQNNSSEGSMTEIWQKSNDSTYTGQAYLIKGKDTLFSESLTIEQRGNDLFYIPTINEQNGGKPVKFTLTSSTNDQLIFENPKHDFPQKINYNKLSNDSLVAEISGTMDGKLNTQQFPMSKIN